MLSTQYAPFRITVCGIEELPDHCRVGVSHMLSIMDPGRSKLPVFNGYGAHVRLDLRFDDVVEPVPGKQPPQTTHVRQILDFGRSLTAEPPGKAHLLVHCHMGVSRSTAAMALILAQARPDRPAAEALAEVARIRPQAWPNLRILEMGGDMLGCRDELLAALPAIYQRATAHWPADWLDYLKKNHRGREVRLLEGG
ncbi:MULTISPECIES: tyrosine phosphatase family protein [unclassified Azospirillum]|uniref:tyrosine phosphatase family protein n=1 Tax=unclassified Azospirillum TaxID=2630922 RepID=UPI000B71ECB0|nr:MULTISPECIES: hypothetical protein [unclassified Azospirillum]SNS42038.1 Predicted protein tyrosine phosphatase [Azospirillum sp. RU38E]SNS60709.1 Predicted protein tyrosine phosphatase [Azospirillum sp. RU37A]